MKFPSAAIAGFAACSSTCHAISIAARPHIFKRALIFSPARGNVLLDLIDHNSDIIRWIKEVAITGYYDKNLLLWLGQPSALRLLSQLQCVTKLQMIGFYLTPSQSVGDLSAAWKNLCCLQSLATLQLETVDLPSCQDAIHILTQSFPHLDRLEVMEVEIPASDSSVFPSLLSCFTLRSIELSSGHEYGFPDYFIERLLSCLWFESLTDLELSIHVTEDYDSGSLFLYVQGLLDHAPALRNLSIGSFLTDPDRISLHANSNLEHLCFNWVKERRDYAEIAHILYTLPNPSRLHVLKITDRNFADMDAQDEPYSWQLLVPPLSAARFVDDTGHSRMAEIIFVMAENKSFSSELQSRLASVTSLGLFQFTTRRRSPQPTFATDE